MGSGASFRKKENNEKSLVPNNTNEQAGNGISSVTKNYLSISPMRTTFKIVGGLTDIFP